MAHAQGIHDSPWKDDVGRSLSTAANNEIEDFNREVDQAERLFRQAEQVLAHRITYTSHAHEVEAYRMETLP